MIVGPTPSPGWKPPPECSGCERPMRRSDFRRQGGYCRTCRPLTASPVQALPGSGRIDVTEWQQLVARRGADERRQEQERAARRRARQKVAPVVSIAERPLFSVPSPKEYPDA